MVFLLLEMTLVAEKSMSKLSGAVVLLTGASGGFGKEFIRQLLGEGSRLILTDINEEQLLSVSKEIQKTVSTGEIIRCIQGDLSTDAGCYELYEQLKTLDVSIDILINNAGIGLYGRLDEVPVDQWQKLMQINLLSPMLLSSLIIPQMIDRREGHIVNISSLAGWVTPEGLTHYCTSKFGMRGLSEGLSVELKPHNIKVTGVYPFFSRTPILNSLAYGSLAKDYQGFPLSSANNPADVIKRVVKGIKQNKRSIFPDSQSTIIHTLKRYFPPLIDSLLKK